MAFAIPRPATAFALSPGKRKRPRVHDREHLDFIRGLPCAVCGKRHVEAAHVRSGALHLGKPEGSLQAKPDDKWTLPLCPDHHREQHSMNEMEFYRAAGIDPFTTAMALYQASGDDEAAEIIMRHARGEAK